jgi:hypothetical protein
MDFPNETILVFEILKAKLQALEYKLIEDDKDPYIQGYKNAVADFGFAIEEIEKLGEDK